MPSPETDLALFIQQGYGAIQASCNDEWAAIERLRAVNELAWRGIYDIGFPDSPNQQTPMLTVYGLNSLWLENERRTPIIGGFVCRWTRLSEDAPLAFRALGPAEHETAITRLLYAAANVSFRTGAETNGFSIGDVALNYMMNLVLLREFGSQAADPAEFSRGTFRVLGLPVPQQASD